MRHYIEYFNGNDISKLILEVLKWQQDTGYEVLEVLCGTDMSRYNNISISVKYAVEG